MSRHCSGHAQYEHGLLDLSEPHLQWIAVFALREKMLAVCFPPWIICEAIKRVHNLLMLHHNFPGAVKRAKLLVILQHHVQAAKKMKMK